MKSASEARQGVLDFFFKRRSIRKFQDREVPEEVIHDLLKAAMAAPTAGNWQPWEFIVVRDKGTRKALSETSPFAGFARDAAVVIVVAGRRDNAWSPFDCALASGNILLAAVNLGLGATYAGLDDEREVIARKILGIPDAYVVYNLIPLGFPAEEKAPHTKYNPARIHWDRFEKGRPRAIVSK
jgi:nitroreductase